MLRLYVAGATPRSVQTITAVHQLLATDDPARYTLEVIDVYQQPELARMDRVVATPTLIRIAPTPACRCVGTACTDDRLASIIWPEGPDSAEAPGDG